MEIELSKLRSSDIQLESQNVCHEIDERTVFLLPNNFSA